MSVRKLGPYLRHGGLIATLLFAGLSFYHLNTARHLEKDLSNAESLVSIYPNDQELISERDALNADMTKRKKFYQGFRTGSYVSGLAFVAGCGVDLFGRKKK
jgi:hypothetical protein